MKSTYRYRAKKRLASTAAETQLGRKIIQHYLGPDGIEMLEAVKKSASKFTNEEDGNKFEQSMCKIAMKIKFMIERKLITLDSAKALTTSWSSSSKILLLSVRPDSKDTELDDLYRKLTETLRFLQELLGENMTDKNVAMLKELCDFYCSHEFLEAVICNEKYVQEKGVIFEKLKLAMEGENPSMETAVQVRQSVPYFADKYSAVIRVVQEFWKAQVIPIEARVATVLYDNLFEIQPEYQALFRTPRKEMEQTFMEEFGKLIQGLSQFEKLSQKLRTLGKMHSELQTTAEAYDQFWQALDASLSSCLSSKYSHRIRDSLELMYKYIADVMKTSARGALDSDEEKTNNAKEVQNFWNRTVLEQEHYVCHTLYEYLFDLHPSYTAFFPDQTPLEIQESLIKMFRHVIDGIDDQEKLKNDFKKFGETHEGKGVSIKSFEHLWDALDLSLMLIFGHLYDSKIRASLSDAFGMVIKLLREAHFGDT